jgi:hypothetical protein
MIRAIFSLLVKPTALSSMAAPSCTWAVFFDLPTNRFLAFSGLASIGESDIVVLLDKVKERQIKEKRGGVHNRQI